MNTSALVWHFFFMKSTHTGVHSIIYISIIGKFYFGFKLICSTISQCFVILNFLQMDFFYDLDSSLKITYGAASPNTGKIFLGENSEFSYCFCSAFSLGCLMNDWVQKWNECIPPQLSLLCHFFFFHQYSIVSDTWRLFGEVDAVFWQDFSEMACHYHCLLAKIERKWLAQGHQASFVPKVAVWGVTW